MAALQDTGVDLDAFIANLKQKSASALGKRRKKAAPKQPKQAKHDAAGPSTAPVDDATSSDDDGADVAMSSSDDDGEDVATSSSDDE